MYNTRGALFDRLAETGGSGFTNIGLKTKRWTAIIMISYYKKIRGSLRTFEIAVNRVTFRRTLSKELNHAKSRVLRLRWIPANIIQVENIVNFSLVAPGSRSLITEHSNH